MKHIIWIGNLKFLAILIGLLACVTVMGLVMMYLLFTWPMIVFKVAGAAISIVVFFKVGRSFFRDDWEKAWNEWEEDHE